MWKAKMALALFFALISVTANAADNLDNKQNLVSLQRLQNVVPFGPVVHEGYQTLPPAEHSWSTNYDPARTHAYPTPSTSESISFVQPSNLKEKSVTCVRGGTNSLLQSVLTGDRAPFIQRFFENSRQRDANVGTRRARRQRGSAISKSGLNSLKVGNGPRVQGVVNDLLLPYDQVLQFSPKQQNGLNLPYEEANRPTLSSKANGGATLPHAFSKAAFLSHSVRPKQTTYAYSFNIPKRQKPSTATSTLKKTPHWYMPMFQLELPNIQDNSTFKSISLKLPKAPQSNTSRFHVELGSLNLPSSNSSLNSSSTFKVLSLPKDSKVFMVANSGQNHENYAEAKKIGSVRLQRSEGQSGKQTFTAPLRHSDIRIGGSARRPAKHFPRAIRRPRLDSFKKSQSGLKGNTRVRKSRPGLVKCSRNVLFSADNHVEGSKSSRKRVESKKRLVRIIKRPVATPESLLPELKALPDPE